MSDESTWDWERVKAAYEQGVISLRSLAAASGHKKSTIESRAKAGKWVKPDGFRTPPTLVAEVSEVSEVSEKVSELSDRVAENLAELSEVLENGESDDMTVVTSALADLAHHLTGDPAQAKLQLNQHKLFADSLSQYVRLKYTLPASGAAPAGIDWSIFSPDELAILQPIFERALQRQQKKPENVVAFRKQTL